MFILLWAAENVTMPPLKIWTNARNYLRAPSGTAERVFQEGRGKQSRFAKRWGLPWLLKKQRRKKKREVGQKSAGCYTRTRHPTEEKKTNRPEAQTSKRGQDERRGEERFCDFVVAPCFA